MNAPAKSLLDIDAFPLVQVREMPRELADVERWLEEVEALLAVERDFALVYPPLPQEEAEGDQQARKRLVLWLKENRQRFVEHCRGILLSANGQPDNLADLQQLAPVLQAVYGPPVSVAPDLASARGMAKALLSGPATGMNWCRRHVPEHSAQQTVPHRDRSCRCHLGTIRRRSAGLHRAAAPGGPAQCLGPLRRALLLSGRAGLPLVRAMEHIV